MLSEGLKAWYVVVYCSTVLCIPYGWKVHRTVVRGTRKEERQTSDLLLHRKDPMPGRISKLPGIS